MTIKVRKVVCQFHYDHLDEHGQLVSEPVVQALPGSSGSPELIVLYPHQFGELEAKANELAVLIEAQLAPEQNGAVAT